MASVSHCGDDSTVPAVVIDNGSGRISAAFAGDDTPRVVFPSIIGYPQQQASVKQNFIGNEAQSKREMCSIEHPIKRGLITNWDAMEELWNHTLESELKVSSKDHPVLLTESASRLMSDREKMTQIMFEKLHIPALYVAMQVILNLYSEGRTTGTVLDSGYGVTQVVPIYEGYGLPHATKCMQFDGSDMTAYMKTLLQGQISSLSTAAAAEVDTVNAMKEKLCHTAFDYEKEIQSGVKSSHYELPDGSKVTVGNERIMVPEAMFKPSLIGSSDKGIHEQMYKSMMKCDVDMRMRDLCCGMAVYGGNTLCPGFVERLHQEMTTLLPPHTKICIRSASERMHAALMGGCILTELSTFREMWISKAEYEESGAKIVHSKCT